jgi:broad specificity phosphatase PhoE
MSGSPKTCIYLIRHGRTNWIDARPWQCRDDSPINDKGMQQAASVAKEMHIFHRSDRIRAIYSSPLLRARQTAGLIASELGMDVRPEPLLRELDCGLMKGLSFAKAAEKYTDIMARLKLNWLDKSYLGGETHRKYAENVVAGALLKIMDEHPGGRVIAVTHGGFITSAIMQLLGSPIHIALTGLSIGNCSYTILELDGKDEFGRPAGRIASINCSSHLRRDGLFADEVTP